MCCVLRFCCHLFLLFWYLISTLCIQSMAISSNDARNSLSPFLAYSIWLFVSLAHMHSFHKSIYVWVRTVFLLFHLIAILWQIYCTFATYTNKMQTHAHTFYYSWLEAFEPYHWHWHYNHDVDVDGDVLISLPLILSTAPLIPLHSNSCFICRFRRLMCLCVSLYNKNTSQKQPWARPHKHARTHTSTHEFSSLENWFFTWLRLLSGFIVFAQSNWR